MISMKKILFIIVLITYSFSIFSAGLYFVKSDGTSETSRGDINQVTIGAINVNNLDETQLNFITATSSQCRITTTSKAAYEIFSQLKAGNITKVSCVTDDTSQFALVNIKKFTLNASI